MTIETLIYGSYLLPIHIYRVIAAPQSHAKTLFSPEHYSSDICQKALLCLEPGTSNTYEIDRPVTDGMR